MATYNILEGDAMVRLAELPAESVQTCITSPPLETYFGLRDYGTAEWAGGDAACDHSGAIRMSDKTTIGRSKGKDRRLLPDAPSRHVFTPYRSACGKCGATRTDSQIGLEETPEQYVANLVAVFREVRRVLRDDGCVWINLGDSYASSGPRGDTRSGFNARYFGEDATASWTDKQGETNAHLPPNVVPAGCKPKDLLGIPWMVAFALRADGWYLRSDIIWAKPNPMPESVTDRPTKAHEYLFLLSKSPRYFWDADAIREADAGVVRPNFDGQRGMLPGSNGRSDAGGDALDRAGTHPNGRNKRSVWTVATQPFPGSHFATFPPKLIEPCVLAGSSPQACAECRAPWERIVEREKDRPRSELRGKYAAEGASVRIGGGSSTIGHSNWHDGRHDAQTHTIGWQPTCDHSDGSARCTVLDPFSGAGTTGVVALRHDRDFIGIELNASYAEMARQRILDDAPLFNVEAA